MNDSKKYKQWKRHLASPKLLIFISLASLLTFLSLSCIVGHYLNYLALYMQSVKLGVQVAPPKFEMNYLYTIPIYPTYLKYLPLLALVIWIIIIPKRIYKMRISYRDINLGTEGTSRFTTVKEAVAQYPSVPLDDNEYVGDSGVPVLHIKDRTQKSGYHKKGSTFTKYRLWQNMLPGVNAGTSNGATLIDTFNTNSITVGGTQSGKTKLFSYPFMDLVMRAQNKDSMLITDIKGNMVKETRQELQRFGYKVLIFNLVNTKLSMRYNPLELTKQAYWNDDIDEAEELARSFAHTIYHQEQSKADPIWENSSIALFVSLVMFVCEQCKKDSTPEKVNLYSLSLFVDKYCTSFDDDDMSPYDHMMEALAFDNPARTNYTTIKMSSGITRSGIYTGFQSELSTFTSRNIAKLTAKSDFDFKELGYGDQPVALFIVAPDYDDSKYKIMSTFISQCSYVLSKAATLDRNSKLKRRVRNLLEEVANIPAINGLSRYMNVGLERGLIYHLVVQSLAQIKDKYGSDGQEALFAACGNKYYIMGDGNDDADAFANLLGKTTVISSSRHGDPMSLDKSYGESEKATDLMRPSELRLLKPGEWVLIRTKHRMDLKGNRIDPRPIMASIKMGTEMLFQNEYLATRFKSNETIDEVASELTEDYDPIDLDDLVIGKNEENLDQNTTEESSEDDLPQFDAITARQTENAETDKKSDESIDENDIDGINETNTPLNFTDAQKQLLVNLYQQKFSKPMVEFLLEATTVEELRNILISHEAEDLYQKIVSMFNIQEGGED